MQVVSAFGLQEYMQWNDVLDCNIDIACDYHPVLFRELHLHHLQAPPAPILQIPH